MTEYILTAVISFAVGFIIAARTKDNITIGFGNQTTTQVCKDGVLQDNKKDL